MTATPSNIHIGGANVYFGVAVPTAGNSVALTAGLPGSGTDVGATQGPAKWTFKSTNYHIRSEQFPSAIGSAITEDSLRIEFVLGEMAYANFKALLAAVKDNTTFVGVGGLFVPTQNSILLVSPKRGGNYIEAMIYSAVFVDGADVELTRSKETGVRIACEGIAQTTRTAGDHLGFLATNVTSA